MGKLEQNFAGLIIHSPFGKREALYVNKEKDAYSWIYEYCDFENHGDRSLVAEGRVEQDFYAIGLKVLMNFKVQPYLKFGTVGWVLDGTLYTLILGEPMLESRFTWHHKLPEEWADFIPILDDLYRNLGIARQQLDIDRTVTQ